MKKEISKEIDEIIKGIVIKVNPIKIILFGSYAVGNENEDSDIDLCIITEDKGSKLEMIWKIRETIFDIAKHSIDLIVYNKLEYIEKKESSTTLANEIAKYGKVLYG